MIRRKIRFDLDNLVGPVELQPILDLVLVQHQIDIHLIWANDLRPVRKLIWGNIPRWNSRVCSFRLPTTWDRGSFERIWDDNCRIKIFFDDLFWSFEPFLDTEGSRKLDPCPPESSQWSVQVAEPLSSLHTSPSAGTLRGSFLCSEPSPGDWLKYFKISYNSVRIPGVKSIN